jgi:Fe2+ transport system protein FeoA
MSTPFGDPNIYALRGTSIALRKSEAKCIRVRI